MLTGDFIDLRRKSKGRTSKLSRSHHVDAKNKARAGIESVGFDLHESPQFVDYVADTHGTLGKYKGGFRWMFLCLVGVGTGIVAVAIQFLLHGVNDLKFGSQRAMHENGYGLFSRYLAWTGISVGLAAIAGILVCYVEPLAAGSGIPEIKCVLNGIDLPNVLRLRTLGCKVIGIVCSVAAGLPCGKEGPMIHSGAIVAAQAVHANAGPHVTPYRVTPEARDFTAAGAAAGVAAAFGAPIGGVLFAVEEGASHMNPTILVRTFVCAALAALTVRFFAGPMEGETAWGTLGTEVPVEFGRFASERRYKVWELPIFAMMGVCGGLCGALFNSLNTCLSRWRMRNIGPRGHIRLVEVVLVAAAIVSFNFFAPLACGGTTDMDTFSHAQRLFVDIGGDAIKELFHSEDRMEMGMLAFFAVAHFAQNILTYGLGVPSGLFVPALLGGAVSGRILGQAVNDSGIIAGHPGVYSMIGATAMLSGMARITISLAVILMETTGEAEWGVPIFATVMAAKWTGDLFGKGIYDVHIDLRSVPLLEHRPEKDMIVLKAHECMATKIRSLPPTARVQDIVDLLAGTRHHAFPVVEAGTNRFLGLVEANTLSRVLQLSRDFGAFVDPSAHAPRSEARVVPFVEMLRRGHPEPPSMTEVRAKLAPEDYEKCLDLLPYTNRGCYTVQEYACALRCYQLFRTMGLRHLPVLGEDHTVRGMLTRKDLLAAAEAMEEHGPSWGDPVANASCATADSEGDVEARSDDTDTAAKEDQRPPCAAVAHDGSVEAPSSSPTAQGA